MKLAEETLLGIDVEVHVNRSGRFTVEIPTEGRRNDEVGWGSDLRTALQTARDTLKKRNLKTAVAFINPRSGERGIATGIHSVSGNVLVRWESGDAEQLRVSRALRPDTPPEVVAKLIDAREVAAKADHEAATIERQWALDLYREVERERTAKLAASRSEAVADG